MKSVQHKNICSHSTCTVMRGLQWCETFKQIALEMSLTVMNTLICQRKSGKP